MERFTCRELFSLIVIVSRSTTQNNTSVTSNTRADPRGELGRRVDVVAGAEGLHRVHQRTAVGAAAATELALALEPVRVLQPRQREVCVLIA